MYGLVWTNVARREGQDGRPQFSDHISFLSGVFCFSRSVEANPVLWRHKDPHSTFKKEYKPRGILYLHGIIRLSTVSDSLLAEFFAHLLQISSTRLWLLKQQLTYNSLNVCQFHKLTHIFESNNSDCRLNFRKLSASTPTLLCKERKNSNVGCVFDMNGSVLIAEEIVFYFLKKNEKTIGKQVSLLLR